MNAVAQTQRRETAFTFPCGEADLVGVLHVPEGRPRGGVVIVVGGPQYRAGAHRQYVLLARRLAQEGVAVLRFDLRGMGDSGGEFRGFEDCGDDIGAAVAALLAHVPDVPSVTLWGLCDGATAIAFHLAEGAADARVTGAVLLNPWARTERTEAAARAQHYYARRLVSREFWRKLLRGGVALGPALAQAGRSLGALLANRLGRSKSGATGTMRLSGGRAPLPDRLAAALERLPVPALLVLSGRDLTAREFETAVLDRPAVTRRVQAGHLRIHRLPRANHTFSAPPWRDQVLGWTLDVITRGEGRP